MFIIKIIKLSFISFSIALLQACNSTSTPLLQYDFSAPIKHTAESTTQTNLKVLTYSIAPINAVSTLGSNAMLYRLHYDNPQILKPYATHSWSMPPAQLLELRLKTRLAANGINALSALDGVTDMTTLRIELDEFSQIFNNAKESRAQINLRISVVKKNKLIGQRSFSQQQISELPNASSGAKAMQQAADDAITQIMTWLATLPN